MPEIKVDGLTKDYGHGRGVYHVTFDVKKGEVFGFLGPNGAGKSTNKTQSRSRYHHPKVNVEQIK